MELEWEQGRTSIRSSLAVPGAILGAALGADCLLAMSRFGDIPTVLCGAAIALFAVRGGALTAGRGGRTRTLLALPWVLLFDCLGHHLCFALESAPGDPAGIWQAFLSLESLPTWYWARLAALAAVSLAAWAMLFHRAGRERLMLMRALQPVRIKQEPAPAEMEIFLPDLSWIRPHLLVRKFSQGIWLAVLFLCLWLDRLTGQEALWSRAVVGMGFSLLLIASLQGPSGRLCAGANWLYVRWEGRLWRVPLNRVIDPELRVPLSRLAQVWELLPLPRRAAFRATVGAVISEGKLEDCRIEKPQLIRQSPWEWAVSDSQAVQHIIPKVYPGFTPVPGEAERVQAAPTVRWINPVVTVLITAVCLAAGMLMGIQEERRPEAPPPPSVEEPAEPEKTVPASTEAIVPEVIGDYILNGVTLRTDDAFQASTNGFQDPEHNVDYQMELRFGVNEDAARLALEETEGEDAHWLQPEGDGFLWRLGENGVAYQYNLRTVRLSDGRLFHTGAALSERGTMLILTCGHGDKIEEETARGTMLYMLENLQFTGPAITEENYQNQLRPAVSMGFNYCGQAFFKAPEGLFPYDAYLDTFLPCGGEVQYYDGGISMMTKAHGLRVSAAVVPNEGTALDVVKEIYEDLKAAGRQYDEGNYLEDAYNEEGNNACRVAVYYDGGRTRVTALVAMEKWKGCYLFKELTCLPEEMDGEYKAVFQEMEKVCGITVSVMEDLGRQQNGQEAGQ